MTGPARPTTARVTTAGPRGWPFRLLVLGVVGFIVLIGLRAVAEAGPAGDGGAAGAASAAATSADPSPGPSVAVAGYLDPFPRPAAPLALTGPDGSPITLADFRGAPLLVFFGYTHCPDVCPVTIGAVGEAIADVDGDAAALFVSVDPERDTIPWLAEFVKYMPAGFAAATGTPAEVRTTADAWGVRYTKVDGDDPAAYAMAHTADVFVVDAGGTYRGRLPFGTDAATMSAVIREVARTPVAADATASPRPAATGAVGDLAPAIVSSSVWAGGASPLILTLADPDGPLDDAATSVDVTVVDASGRSVGTPTAAVAVQPEGIDRVSYVAMVDLPSPGAWQLLVEATAPDGTTRTGTVPVEALDPGGTAALGAPAPTIRTPTAADFGGDLAWVTTDPAADPRLSATSTTDALAAGRPFVFVVDSYNFKVTPVCGKAVVMAKQLVHRWTHVPFIHHEPYRYTIATSTAVLEGTLQDPVLTEAADAWGVGSAPWGEGSMPWLFVVDGEGIVLAKYQGIMGSADVDVLLTLLLGDPSAG